MKKRKNKKWYKICSVCKGKIKYYDEMRIGPVYYVSKKPINPSDWDFIDKIRVFCGPDCSLTFYERTKHME